MKLFLLLALVSCANHYQEPTKITQSYNVTVDAISSPNSSNYKSFAIVGEINDLQFQEASAIVSRGLVHSSFVQSESPDKADLKLTLTYTIGEPVSTVESDSVPHSVTSDVRTVYGARVGSITGTNYRTEIETITRYKRELKLVAKDNQGHTIWEVRSISKGRSSNLREIVPFLAFAATSVSGTNYNATMQIPENDPRVLKLAKE